MTSLSSRGKKSLKEKPGLRLGSESRLWSWPRRGRPRSRVRAPGSNAPNCSRASSAGRRSSASDSNSSTQDSTASLLSSLDFWFLKLFWTIFEREWARARRRTLGRSLRALRRRARRSHVVHTTHRSSFQISETVWKRLERPLFRYSRVSRTKPQISIYIILSRRPI